MATTTNYGWTTPNDTDLVKDGAAAIRTLGSSVDTTTKALNPETTLGDIAYRSATANTNTRLAVGTTGQVLTVAGGVPSWATPTVGDITAVSAGTGISGGGTSGDITITNSMATAIDAKGDLVVGTGADTFSRLAVGTNTYVLTADSAEATGLKWAAAASGSTLVGCQLEKITSAQSVSNGTSVAITFNSEVYDTDGFHDNSTNNTRITIPTGKGGKYQFTIQLSYAANATGSRITKLFKNGALVQLLNVSSSAGAADYAVNASTCLITAVAGDYFEAYAEQYSGGSLNVNYSAGNGVGCFFGCTYLGA
jgi:hypothetical protein